MKETKIMVEKNVIIKNLFKKGTFLGSRFSIIFYLTSLKFIALVITLPLLEEQVKLRLD